MYKQKKAIWKGSNNQLLRGLRLTMVIARFLYKMVASIEPFNGQDILLIYKVFFV